jgi:hypothetical protein
LDSFDDNGFLGGKHGVLGARKSKLLGSTGSVIDQQSVGVQF